MANHGIGNEGRPHLFAVPDLPPSDDERYQARVNALMTADHAAAPEAAATAQTADALAKLFARVRPKPD